MESKKNICYKLQKKIDERKKKKRFHMCPRETNIEKNHAYITKYKQLLYSNHQAYN